MEFFSIEWDKKIQDNAYFPRNKNRWTKLILQHNQKKPQIKGPSDLSGEIIQSPVVLFFNSDCVIRRTLQCTIDIPTISSGIWDLTVVRLIPHCLPAINDLLLIYKVTSRFTDDQVKGSFTPRESGGESERDQRKYDKRQMKFSLLLPLSLSVNGC